MIVAKVIIKRKDDPEPAMAGITPDNLIMSEISEVVILEGGMTSGKTSIAFRVNLPDGKVVIAQTSAEILRGISGALEGAEQSFKD